MQINPIAPNMTEVEIGGATILFSYKTPVAARVGNKYYKVNKRYSATTSRHVSKWLAGVDAEPVSPDFFDELTCSCRL